MKQLLLCGIAVLALSACNQNADQEGARGAAAGADSLVLIDGSSTVYPISEALSEEFQGATGNRVTVGLSGTGGGFKKFCRGEIDIAGASRPIKAEEVELCKQNGIEFVELPVALDALAVIVNPQNNWADCLSVEELRTMWQPSAQGTVTKWNQVRASFPDRPLTLFGPGTDSGTFDYFTKAINGEEGASRGDYTATEDDNVTVTGVAGDPNALGYLGLAYYAENTGRVRAVPIRQADGSCVAPSVETARDGSYQPLSRPLFYYVNPERAETRPQVGEFIRFAFTPGKSEELVREVGYVPLPSQAYQLAQQKFEARRTGSFFDGGSKIGVTVDELLSDAAPAPKATQ